MHCRLHPADLGHAALAELLAHPLIRAVWEVHAGEAIGRVSAAPILLPDGFVLHTVVIHKYATGGAACSMTVSCSCLLTSCAPPVVAGRPPDAPPAGIPAAAHDPGQPGCNNHLLCHDGEVGCLACSTLYGSVSTLSLWAAGLAAAVLQAPSPAKPAWPGLPSASAAGTFELLPLLPSTQEDFKPIVKRHKGFKYAAERPQARDFMHQKWGWRATQPGAHRFSCGPTECWALRGKGVLSLALQSMRTGCCGHAHHRQSIQ